MSVREGSYSSEGASVRCVNPECGREGRYLGVFFSGTLAFLPCPSCKRINRIEVRHHVVSVDLLPAWVTRCPKNGT